MAPIPVNLRSFKQKVRHNKSVFKRFLTKVEKKPVKGLDAISAGIDKQVWEEVDCLTCANCCKTMSPTYTPKDLKRISAHFGMKPIEFKEKWLRKDTNGDWMNKTEPCQFLNLENNYCSIYEIRPADCAGFPHHTKKNIRQYVHVFKQNIEYCPATYKWVEKMKESLPK
jgi:hypothetical protein